MSPAAGVKLGPYELIAPIGKGGMGEVYRAIDTRLRREVAIKICADRFTERFEREARAIASLNHPNICHLYDVGPNYLVMELVEGPTLADRIARGALPVQQALAIARQIAEALEAAHEKGIVHRDLKPANIKIKSDGTVKVLDFGLAKSAEESDAADDPNNSPTVINSRTQAGVILGTAAYMSPEQARGAAVDKRADIWAFGCVLYEMLTGERAFQGSTVSDTIVAVLTKEPEFATAPVEVRRLIAACLEKDAKKRMRDIGDYQRLLEPENGTEIALRTRVRPAFWIGATAVLAFLLTSLSFFYFRQVSAEAPVVRTSILPPDGTSLADTSLALSPDSRRLVFSAQSSDGKVQLWLRSLDSTAAQPLAGTENGREPFWSPDGKSVGFFSDGKLKRIDIAGGPVAILAEAPNMRGASWSAQGIIVFAPSTSGTLRKVSASGGAVTDATRGDTGQVNTHRWPWFLPDGRHFLFTARNPLTGRNIIRAGSLDSLESQALTEADFHAVYAQGRLLYLRDNTLMAQPFDPNSLKLTGEAAPVAEGVRNSAGVAWFFSAAGDLVYLTGAEGRSEPAWFDRGGRQVASPGGPDGHVHIGPGVDASFMSLSPDRKNIAATVYDPSHNPDIWIYDVVRGLRTRFTFDAAFEGDAVWSPDGATIVFSSTRKGNFDLYRRKSDGGGSEELLFADGVSKRPTSFSPDGRLLPYHVMNQPKTGYDLWILPNPLGPPGASKPYPLLRTPFNESNAQFSPDGKWIAYQSDESGRLEVYVARFPGPGGKKPISTGGGRYPRWRSDAREIFYVTDSGRLTAAEISEKSDRVEVGATTPLFGSVAIGNGYSYDISADGQRILAIMPSRQSNSEPLTLVQNWTALLKK